MVYIKTGTLKGRRLKIPKSARVSQGLLRQKIFDFLADFVKGARILDLYAGAGTFGFEAFSRGASHVTFVENNIGAILRIKQNLERLGLQNISNGFTIIRSEVDVFLNNEIKKYQKVGATKYDIIFIDPPYKKILNQTVEHQKRYVRKVLFKAYKLLNNNAVVILKLHKKIPVTLMSGMALLKTINHGINAVYVLVQPQANQYEKKLAGERLIYGSKEFVQVGGRKSTKIKKGIKKKKLNEQDYYEFSKLV